MAPKRGPSATTPAPTSQPSPSTRTTLLYKHKGSLNACALANDAGVAVLGGDQLQVDPFSLGNASHVLAIDSADVLCELGEQAASLANGKVGAAKDSGACGSRPALNGAVAASASAGAATPAQRKRTTAYELHSHDVWGASVSGDGLVAATCDLGGIIHVWGTQAAEQRTSFSLGTHGMDPVSVALSHDACSVLATDGSALALWDVARCGSVALERNPEPRNRKRLVSCALVGNVAAAAGEDGRVYLWDKRVAEVRSSLEYHVGCVNGVAIAARNDTCVVSAGTDRVVCVWDTRKALDPLLTLKGHAMGVSACAVDESGKRVVSAGCDKKVRVWEGGRCLSDLGGHKGAVESCAVSADGSVVLSVGKGGQALLYTLGRDAGSGGRAVKERKANGRLDRSTPGDVGVAVGSTAVKHESAAKDASPVAGAVAARDVLSTRVNTSGVDAQRPVEREGSREWAEGGPKQGVRGGAGEADPVSGRRRSVDGHHAQNDVERREGNAPREGRRRSAPAVPSEMSAEASVGGSAGKAVEEGAQNGFTPMEGCTSPPKRTRTEFLNSHSLQETQVGSPRAAAETPIVARREPVQDMEIDTPPERSLAASGRDAPIDPEHATPSVASVGESTVVPGDVRNDRVRVSDVDMKDSAYAPPSKKAAAAAMAAAYRAPENVEPLPSSLVSPTVKGAPVGTDARAEPMSAAAPSATTTVGSSEPSVRDPRVVSVAPAVFHTALVSRGLSRGDGLVHADAVEEIGALFNNDVLILDALGEYAIAERLCVLDISSDFRIREAEFIECVRSVQSGIVAFQKQLCRNGFTLRAGGEDGFITIPQAREMVLASGATFGYRASLDTVRSMLDAVALPSRRLGLNEMLSVMQSLAQGNS